LFVELHLLLGRFVLLFGLLLGQDHVLLGLLLLELGGGVVVIGLSRSGAAGPVKENSATAAAAASSAATRFDLVRTPVSVVPLAERRLAAG
jgi:hypothetical protein